MTDDTFPAAIRAGREAMTAKNYKAAIVAFDRAVELGRLPADRQVAQRMAAEARAALQKK